MDAKTLEALKASIAKWERNAIAGTPTVYKTGPDDCPLCFLFFADGCVGCPAAEKTGCVNCDGSPYQDAYDAWEGWSADRSSLTKRTTAHKAARAEVTILKSLLPTEG